MKVTLCPTSGNIFLVSETPEETQDIHAFYCSNRSYKEEFRMELNTPHDKGSLCSDTILTLTCEASVVVHENEQEEV